MTGSVLIVEDDDDSRELLASLLSLSGCDVRTASDGCEAWQVLTTASAPPKLVLLDLMMPRMNGWELMERVTRDPVLAQIAIVVVSGVADMEQEAVARGARAALIKPVDPKLLLDVVQQHCA